VALGGWAALALALVPAPAALAAGSGSGATDGPDQPLGAIGEALGPVAGGGPATAGAVATVGAGAAVAASPAPAVVTVTAADAFAPRALTGSIDGAQHAQYLQVAIRRGADRDCALWRPGARRFVAGGPAGCAGRGWMTARLAPSAERRRWSIRLGGPLPRGTHRFVVRVLDPAGRPLAIRLV
jgi:hypothetical protein